MYLRQVRGPFSTWTVASPLDRSSEPFGPTYPRSQIAVRSLSPWQMVCIYTSTSDLKAKVLLKCLCPGLSPVCLLETIVSEKSKRMRMFSFIEAGGRTYQKWNVWRGHHYVRINTQFRYKLQNFLVLIGNSVVLMKFYVHLFHVFPEIRKRIRIPMSVTLEINKSNAKRVSDWNPFFSVPALRRARKFVK